MLHLAGASASDWGDRALAHIDEILLDHAHCEKKAASTALSMIFRFPSGYTTPTSAHWPSTSATTWSHAVGPRRSHDFLVLW